ncbi:MAG: UDP-N-acetylmuramoyl-L-alanyl-D-glutamate--2,6-diaminopimelate ligase [Desulfobacteraceae bacterium]|nr:UDP-N-acetylmuramoyl-L-alanyl-D-glutamate--2,6-diaminopimelate ligase [Desulfobacteraceae bacterium]
MKLSRLIEGCEMINNTIADIEITKIASRAQDITPGGLFIAVQGFTADGHDYMKQALEKGAAAIIAQKNPDNLENVILVKNSRKATAGIADRFFGQPSADMNLVGITGTNGKTTITYILESIFNACGFETGVIGTVNIRYKGQTFNNPVTTPDAIDLQKTLREMKKAGVTHVIMEASSHGIDLHRIDHCQFNAKVFTNLSQDHLDYHADMAEYFACKKRFFTEFPLNGNGETLAPSVINIDDPKGKEILADLCCDTFSVSTRTSAQICSQNVTDDINGLSGEILFNGTKFSFCSELTGQFNLENILCAVGAAKVLGIEKDKIQKGIEDCKVVPGRLEKIDNHLERHIFVDYAHTPGALESILATLKQRAPKRMITVFGCGGDRDTSKRPLMGEVAVKYSDISIVTSDNPRTENPDAIIKEIIKGIDPLSCPRLDINNTLSPDLKSGHLLQPNRKKALHLAVRISKPGDIIVAAGKGHETYQITNQGTIHLDDREELSSAIKEMEIKFSPIPWKIKDFEAALGRPPVLSTITEDLTFASVSTDSRMINTNELFVALKGENFDAHDFIPDLLEKGIKGFVVEKNYFEALGSNANKKIKGKDLLVFETDNTLMALGQLARFQKRRSGVKLLAITGSNGKTSTRKITQEIFKTRFHTLATQGNFNNEIGMPLTLLKLSRAHEWAIIEMGMNHPGEISRLSDIAEPDIALITNTAGAHLEGLGTVNNVAKAKSEIFESIGANGTAIINADDGRRDIMEACARANKDINKILLFGLGRDATVKGSDVTLNNGGTQFMVNYNGQAHPFTINSPAPFMVNNSLAACAAALTAGISPDEIRQGLLAFSPVAGRMNILSLTRDVHLIDDTYNANPSSMTGALNTLALLSKDRQSIAILGDMLELGDDTDALHSKIGKTAEKLGISRLFLFGSQTKHTRKGALAQGMVKDKIFHGKKQAIAKRVVDIMEKDAWILVKGSRGMRMETIIHEMKLLLKGKN